MVLEATVVILDNSEWMRNGDFVPSRFDVQQDAAHLICNTKRQSNVESSVAIMTMAGPSPKVSVTLTSEQSKLQHALASTRLEGHSSCNFASALQVAQLVLKNRQNSNQRQRIVVFIGSPLSINTPDELTSLLNVGKILKKNGVSLDVVNFGGENVDLNQEAIIHILAGAASLDLKAAQAHIQEALTAPDCTCHLLTVRTGEDLNDALMTSPILLGADGSATVANFGMDEDMDPELAMALKLSLEEEQQRLQREKSSGAAAPIPPSTTPESTEMAIDVGEDDEDAMLARAIAMSMESADQEPKDNTKQQKQE